MRVRAWRRGEGSLSSLFLQEGGSSWEVAGQDISLFFGKVNSLYPVFFFLSLNSKVIQLFVENSETIRQIVIIPITT